MLTTLCSKTCVLLAVAHYRYKKKVCGTSFTYNMIKPNLSMKERIIFLPSSSLSTPNNLPLKSICEEPVHNRKEHRDFKLYLGRGSCSLKPIMQQK